MTIDSPKTQQLSDSSHFNNPDKNKKSLYFFPPFIALVIAILLLIFRWKISLITALYISVPFLVVGGIIWCYFDSICRYFYSSRSDLLRTIGGYTLAFCKIISSAALCIVFVYGALTLLNVPSPLSIFIAIPFAVCNAIICAYSRGKIMIESLEREKSQNKASNGFDWITVFIFLACVSATVTSFAGIIGFFSFVGVYPTLAITTSNISLLVGSFLLAIIAGLSFYSFQAAGVRKNIDSFNQKISESLSESKAKLVSFGLIVLLFCVAYSVITFFTIDSGTTALAKLFGAGKMTGLITEITVTLTCITMFVNAFSQVFKVFKVFFTNTKAAPEKTETPEEKTETPEEKTETPEKKTENSNRKTSPKEPWYKPIKVFLIVLASAGDITAYTIAASATSAYKLGSVIASSIGGSVLGWQIGFGVISLLVLFCVNIAYTYYPVFEAATATAPADASALDQPPTVTGFQFQPHTSPPSSTSQSSSLSNSSSLGYPTSPDAKSLTNLSFFGSKKSPTPPQELPTSDKQDYCCIS